MNKKTNTLLFIIGATIANIIIMAILFFLGFFIASRFLSQDAPPNVILIVFMLIFICSVMGSFLIYHRIIKLISKKIDMEKYFHPIFKRRSKK